MKPANFPGRKNARRIGAQARLNYSTMERAEEARTLSKRIVPDEQARAVRTKKDRSSRAKVRA